MARKVNTDLIEARRERVAYWRLRGKTQREVVRLLADEGFLNPETAAPFGLTAVNDDCKALRVLWKREQAAKLDDAKGTVLAELRAVRAASWAGAASQAAVDALVKAMATDESGDVRAEAAKALGRMANIDYQAILNSLKQESVLLGLDAPTKAATFDLSRLADMSDDELDRLEKGLVKGGRISNLIA